MIFPCQLQFLAWSCFIATEWSWADKYSDHELNRLIREHEATAVIHTGDFGFINADSLERMGDK